MSREAWATGQKNGLAAYGELFAEQLGITVPLGIGAGASVARAGLPWGNVGASQASLALQITMPAAGNTLDLLLEPFTSTTDANPNPLQGNGIEVVSAFPLANGLNYLLLTWDNGPLPGNMLHRTGITDTVQSLNLNPVYQGPWAFYTLTIRNNGAAIMSLDWLSYAWRATQ